MWWDHLCRTTFMTMVGCMALPWVLLWMCLWAGQQGPAAQGMYNGPGDPGWCDFLVTNHQAGALAEPGPFWMPWFSMCVLRAVWSCHALRGMTGGVCRVVFVCEGSRYSQGAISLCCGVWCVLGSFPCGV